MNARIIRIIRYLNKERMASYKEIADALDMKERSVRYDIDSINDELSLAKQDQIEKLPKGMLLVPDKLNLEILVQDELFFVFSPEERQLIVKFYVLFGIDRLNIRKLTDDLGVSRRSIQNDLKTVGDELTKYDIDLVFDKKYYLKGESDKSFDVRCVLMQRLLPALYKKSRHNDFEKYIRKSLGEIYGTVSIDAVLGWIKDISEEMEWVFSDEAYHRYMARVLTFTWYVIYNRTLPETEGGENRSSGVGLKAYEKIIGRNLSETEENYFSALSKLGAKYEDLDIHLPLVQAADCAKDLIRAMRTELHVDFENDGILAKGLLNHIVTLIERIRAGKQLNRDVSDLVPEGYEYVYEALDGVLAKTDIFRNLTKNEKIYLSIYFMGSLRRIQRESYMSVLLVCGYGYGTTAMLKDTLLNEYQVYVRDSIPAYRVADYEHWDEIDVVISTVKMMLPVDKPFAQVNIVFNKDDYVKLDFLGLRRKQVLTDYFAIERRLDFLKEDDRAHVMQVLQEEMGFRQVRIPKRLRNLTDLLPLEHIRCVPRLDTWQEAVRAGTDILMAEGLIKDRYRESILRGIEIQGFYSVTDQKFALLHGKASAGVNVSCMSLVVSRECVAFGEKEVKLIFCLASLDKKEHIPAVVSLSRMAENSKFIEDVSAAKTPREAFAQIQKYEQRQRQI